MTWNYWITLYLQRHCAARGLSTTTIAAYGATLHQFQSYVDSCLNHKAPDEIRPADVLRYLEYLRRERNNGDSAVNRQLTILKNFYRAIVALGHLLPEQNPLARMPKIKGVARKLPVVLSEKEVQRLLAAPAPDTVLGLRDRAILLLLYGTGIRASECAQLKQGAVDDPHRQITVTGKGGHQRSLPLNDRVADALRAYQAARGVVDDEESFFRSRHNRGMSRGSIYARVRYWSQQAKITKRVSPHQLRHTFATHLVREGVQLVTIRDLLGHRLITSTQIYLHVTAQELRKAAALHPIDRLAPLIADVLPEIRIPWQHASPPVRDTG